MQRLTAGLKTKQAQLVLTGALLGAAAFLLLYGFSPLNPANDAWLRGGYVERDTVQHYAGWLFYRASPLTFPLGIATEMNPPFGGYVGLSDSIPIFALLFRLLAGVLPVPFQYFGLWGFLCSILQGAAAALLLGLFTQNRLYNALLSLLFVFAPIFLDRQLRHGSLGAQWLILFALYLYFKHRRAGTFYSVGFVALCALSITIHPYFVPMVFAVLAALLLENAAKTKKWGQAAAMLGISLAATLAAGFVMGAFSTGTDSGSTPYGYFSMNLNALWNPSSRGYHWSLFLPAQNQTLGNYDGFNYLGLGVLLVLAAMAVDAVVHIRQRPLRRFVAPHWGLLLVSACLFVFAVSNQVTAQGRVLLTLPLPKVILDLAGMFRSSGRMFYPVWYLLLLAACVYLLRRPPVKWRTAAVCGLVLVQMADLSPALLAKATDFRPYQAMPSPMQSDFWDETAGCFGRIASLDEEGLYAAMDLALYAADNGMVDDDAFTARFDTAQRNAQRQENLALLTGGAAPADTLFITSVEATFLEYAEALQGDFYCARIDGGWYVFAPYSGDFTGYSGADALPIDAYPLTIADYTDGLWDHGVLLSDRRVVCFEDSAFARRRVDGPAALRAPDGSYRILDVDYGDAGWILVTLDRDATALQGQPLESLP